jgi:hypothetical protein
MRVGCISLLMMAALLVQAQQDPLATKSAGDLSIPAELTKTVRADKAQRGDPVEFTTLEAVLIGPKLVMPPQSKLFGRVVGAPPRQGDKPSWLVLLVERAEWKQHSVPLHAFISSQIALVPGPNLNINPADNTAASNPRRTGRMSGRVAAQSDSELSSLTKPPQDASEMAKDGTVAKPVALKDVRIVRDKDGISYLFSAKSDVKLPSGTLFMLQNRPTTAPDQSAAAGPH